MKLDIFVVWLICHFICSMWLTPNYILSVFFKGGLKDIKWQLKITTTLVNTQPQLGLTPVQTTSPVGLELQFPPPVIKTDSTFMCQQYQTQNKLPLEHCWACVDFILKPEKTHPNTHIHKNIRSKRTVYAQIQTHFIYTAQTVQWYKQGLHVEFPPGFPSQGHKADDMSTNKAEVKRGRGTILTK